MGVASLDGYRPWPLSELRTRLCSTDTLWQLCQPRLPTAQRDARENSLETLVGAVMADHFGHERVTMRKQIGRTLGLGDAPFPGQSLPDIVINVDGAFYICELKSSRTDYGRFDDVFDSAPFKAYLGSVGHEDPPPWEVEQDLIKLRLYHGLSDRVRGCLFLMVDAYAGKSLAWADAFGDVDLFRATMRTALVQGWAEELVSGAAIYPLAAGEAQAKLIVCEVGPAGGDLSV